MKHSKTIVMNALFVANAYLQSYISNNVNDLITFIVHYFVNYIPNFLYKYFSLPLCGDSAPLPQTAWVRIISLLFVNLEDVWVVLCVLRTRNTTRCKMRMATSRMQRNCFIKRGIQYNS